MSVPVNFLIGNHPPFVVPEDIFEYLAQGLRLAGQPVHYALDEYRPKAINLVMEGFSAEFGRTLADSRRRHAGSRLYVIATELLGPGGFNSANTVHTADGDHYSNAGYWTARTQGFEAALPAVDGLVYMAESLLPGYARLGVRGHYLPLAPLPAIAPIVREPEPLRDVDVYFSGMLTKHRVGVLDRLRDEGLEVFRGVPQYPDYVRRHFLARSRLAVGLRLEAQAGILSKQRAHYYLVHRIPHLFERTPDRTDLHDYVQFADPGEDFVERCYQLAQGLEAFPDAVFDAYRADPRFEPRRVFDALLGFLRG